PPLLSDTSRSPERPPSITATLPNLLLIYRFSDDSDFLLQFHAVFAPHRVAHMGDQPLDVRRLRLPQVDDEVRVLFRHLRIADAVALEAAGLDQPGRMVVRRVAEGRSRVGQIERLRCESSRQQALDL